MSAERGQDQTVGRWTVTANPIFVKEFTDGRDPGVEFEYAWGTYYRLQPEFEPGFEAFKKFGEISNAHSLSTQEHFAGPDVRGRIHLGKRDNLVYNLGYLFGVTDAAPTAQSNSKSNTKCGSDASVGAGHELTEDESTVVRKSEISYSCIAKSKQPGRAYISPTSLISGGSEMIILS